MIQINSPATVRGAKMIISFLQHFRSCNRFKKHIPGLLLFALLLGCAILAPDTLSRADTVILNNGNKIENVKVWTKGNQVSWYQYGSLVSMDKSAIKRIEYQDQKDTFHLQTQTRGQSKTNKPEEPKKKYIREVMNIHPCLGISVYKEESGQVHHVIADCKGISIGDGGGGIVYRGKSLYMHCSCEKLFFRGHDLYKRTREVELTIRVDKAGNLYLPKIANE